MPFPPNDPVYKSKRENVENPFLEVDLPYMVLRLRQGVGRLIRTHEDKGTIHICMDANVAGLVKNAVIEALPVTAM